MPNKNFYRDHVAFYAEYGYRDPLTGSWIEGYTDPVIQRVNIQPFKDGEMLTFAESTTYYQKGYKKVYTKELPVFPENPPENSAILFYFNGEFYQVKGSMNYTTPGRGPKHYKLLATMYPNGTEPDIEPPEEVINNG